MQQSSSPIIGFVVIAALVTVSILVRRGRLQSRSTSLAPRERIRPLAITLLDPVISLLIIAPFVWHFIAHSTVHFFAALLGGAVGVLIGYARARVMFVRAIRETKSIVLRRSGLEYGLVLILIVLRSAQGSVERSSSSTAQTAVTALAGLALVEAIARSGFIVQRYLDAPPSTDLLAPQSEPPT